MAPLTANTPQLVTVWGVHYPEVVDGAPAGFINRCADEALAREWFAEEQAGGIPVEFVCITGHPYPADAAVTDGGTR